MVKRKIEEGNENIFKIISILTRQIVQQNNPLLNQKFRTIIRMQIKFQFNTPMQIFMHFGSIVVLVS